MFENSTTRIAIPLTPLPSLCFHNGVQIFANLYLSFHTNVISLFYLKIKERKHRKVLYELENPIVTFMLLTIALLDLMYLFV